MIIYVFANCITLVAIIKTVVIKIVLAGSSKMGILTEEFRSLIMFHSIKIEVLEKLTKRVINIDKIEHRNRI